MAETQAVILCASFYERFLLAGGYSVSNDRHAVMTKEIHNEACIRISHPVSYRPNTLASSSERVDQETPLM